MTCAIIFACARGWRWPTFLDAMIDVTPFLTMLFHLPFLADLKLSKSGPIRSTSSGGKDELASSASDILKVKIDQPRRGGEWCTKDGNTESSGSIADQV